MKSGKEITTKIQKEEEDLRLKQVKLATDMIDQTSEMMFEKSLSKMAFPKESNCYDFGVGITQPEVKELLQENGFKIEPFNNEYYLLIAK